LYMKLYYHVSETPLGKSRQRELALGLLERGLTEAGAVIGTETGTEIGEILRGEFGKPYLANSDICFNYAHCEYGVACAVGSSEVGVDIQEIRAVSPAVVRRVCCAGEIREIESGGNSDFIKIWVQKEAYAKFTGRGLAEGFARIDTSSFPPERVFRQGNVWIAYYTSLKESVKCLNCRFNKE
jgi:phosphopantetheinyl transferase